MSAAHVLRLRGYEPQISRKIISVGTLEGGVVPQTLLREGGVVREEKAGEERGKGRPVCVKAVDELHGIIAIVGAAVCHGHHGDHNPSDPHQLHRGLKSEQDRQANRGHLARPHTLVQRSFLCAGPMRIVLSHRTMARLCFSAAAKCGAWLPLFQQRTLTGFRCSFPCSGLLGHNARRDRGHLTFFPG